jgi:hypothetical protein
VRKHCLFVGQADGAQSKFKSDQYKGKIVRCNILQQVCSIENIALHYVVQTNFNLKRARRRTQNQMRGAADG